MSKAAWLLLLFPHLALSQWVWQNPLPTGNDFLAIHFVDSLTGVISGTNGTVFRTTDGGAGWKPVFDLPFADYLGLSGVDAGHVWMQSMGGGSGTKRLLFTSDAGATWEERFTAQNLPEGGPLRVNDMEFISTVLGYLVGDSGIVRKTTDGGYTWVVDQQVGDKTLNDIQMLDDSVGFLAGGDLQVLGDDVFYASRSQGNIFRTTDGGSSWQETSSDTMSITRICFITSLIGWAASEVYWEDSSHDRHARYYLLNTTDGGVSWTKELKYSSVSDIFFLDELTGYHAAGSDIYGTTDAGATWAIMSFESASGGLSRILFPDPLHGFAVGTGGTIRQYSWTGAWSHYDRSTLGGTNNDVFFVDADTGMIATEHMLQRTTDAGATWNAVGISSIFSIDCPDDRNCWAVGWGGVVYRSRDAGKTWDSLASGVTSHLLAVAFFDTMTGWAGGYTSTLLKTIDGGEHWAPQTPPPILGSVNRIVIQDPDRIWIRSLSIENASSTDGGSTWTKVDSGLVGMFFLSPDTGWGRDYSTLYRTLNGGLTWDPVGPGNVPDPQFTDLENGWSAQSSRISRTSNGGASWSTELGTPYSHELRAMHMIDSSHGWVVGGSGTVIRYGYADRVTAIGASDAREVPAAFSLHQNYPNPFNSSTTIRFSVPAGGLVSLKVFDILGREVATLVNERMGPGAYQARWDAGKYPSGSYVVRLVSADFTETRKMLIMR